MPTCMSTGIAQPESQISKAKSILNGLNNIE